MENKNNKWWIVLGVVVVIVLVFWFVNKSGAPAPASTGNTGDNALQVDSTEDTSTGSVNSGNNVASISYQEALVKYKDARLQIQKTCQASPDKMTFKNNAYMMVDNRTASAITVKVGSTFPIKAYGFKIVQLSSANLPATWLVDCNSSQNVATITIQK